jgi:hypothetical protein
MKNCGGCVQRVSTFSRAYTEEGGSLKFIELNSCITIVSKEPEKITATS